MYLIELIKKCVRWPAAGELRARVLNIFIFALLSIILYSCGTAPSRPAKPKAVLEALENLQDGIAYYRKGCFPNSLNLFFKAYEQFVLTGNSEEAAQSLNNIGNTYQMMGEVDQAILFFDESFLLFKEANQTRGMAQALSNKAAALIESGRLETAREVLKQTETYLKMNHLVFAPHLRNKGILEMKSGNILQAETSLRVALKQTLTADAPANAAIQFSLGTLMAETGRLEKALAFFQDALQTDRRYGVHLSVADDLAALGNTYERMGNAEQAETHYIRAVQMYAILGKPENVSAIMAKLDRDGSRKERLGLIREIVDAWLMEKRLYDVCD